MHGLQGTTVTVIEQMLKFTVIMKAYREAGFTGAVNNQGNANIRR